MVSRTRALPTDVTGIGYALAKVLGWDDAAITTDAMVDHLNAVELPKPGEVFIYNKFKPITRDRLSMYIHGIRTPSQEWMDAHLGKIKTFRPDYWAAHGQRVMQLYPTLPAFAWGGTKKMPAAGTFGEKMARVIDWPDPAVRVVDIANHFTHETGETTENDLTLRLHGHQAVQLDWINQHWHSFRSWRALAWERHALDFGAACDELKLSKNRYSRAKPSTEFADRVKIDLRQRAGLVFGRVGLVPLNSNLSTDIRSALIAGSPTLPFDMFGEVAFELVRRIPDMPAPERESLQRLFPAIAAAATPHG